MNFSGISVTFWVGNRQISANLFNKGVSFFHNSYSSFIHAQQEDIFALEAAELGNLFKIKLRHDNSNFSPSWFVDRVEIRDLETDKLYPFVCERWLSKKKEGGKIQRTLYVKGYEVYFLN